MLKAHDWIPELLVKCWIFRLTWHCDLDGERIFATGVVESLPAFPNTRQSPGA
jgi:hypothetical protein